MSGRIHIGCSGWQYASWRGSVYPATLPTSEWLSAYTAEFETVEVNNTFYRLPPKGTFARWRRATPAGFVMAVKASRYLTHLKGLTTPGPPLTRLFSRAIGLGARLGPMLYQLPATLEYDPDRLRVFLREVAARTQRALRTRSNMLASPNCRVMHIRHVIEFRHPSWYREDVLARLRRARVAVCQHDMPGSAIAGLAAPPFVYVRFHGTTGKYSGTYTDETLAVWGARLRDAAAQGIDAYAYFNNDVGGTAVANARTLRRYSRRAASRPAKR